MSWNYNMAEGQTAFPSDMASYNQMQNIPGIGYGNMMAEGQSLPNQQPQQQMQDPMAQYQEQMRRQQMYKMMGQGLMGAGKNMQMQMPSGNTAQIIRDQGGPRMQQNPQQQMAQALRRRG